MGLRQVASRAEHLTADDAYHWIRRSAAARAAVVRSPIELRALAVRLATHGGCEGALAVGVGFGDVPAEGLEVVAGGAEPVRGVDAGGVGVGPAVEVVALEAEAVVAALAGADRVAPLEGGALFGGEAPAEVDDLGDVGALGDDGGE